MLHSSPNNPDFEQPPPPQKKKKKKKPYENIVGKGENAGTQLFLTMFSTYSKKNFHIQVDFILVIYKCFNPLSHNPNL